MSIECKGRLMWRSGGLGRLSERNLPVDGILGNVVIPCFTTGCDAGGSLEEVDLKKLHTAQSDPVVWLKKTTLLLRADAGLGTIQLPEDLQATPSCLRMQQSQCYCSGRLTDSANTL
jgi:hypothetical protein